MTQTIENTLTNRDRVSDCTIKVNGQNLSEEMMSSLMDVTIEQSLYIPSMANIRLHSPYLQWFDSSELAIGHSLEVALGAVNSLSTVFKGEITSMEFDAAPNGMPIVTIQGFDKLHRLHRGRKTKVYLQVSDSDIFTQVMSDASVTASVDSTTEVFDYVLQNNETDWEFVQRRANRIGREIIFDHSSGQASIRKRPASPSTCATIDWGVELTDLKVRLTASNQISGVTVRGWDPKTKQAIVGQASSGDFNPSLGYSKTGSLATSDFGTAKAVSIFRDVATQSEATDMATAIYENMTGQFIQAEGECFGNAAIAPGKNLKVEKVATNYSGQYYLTNCSHHYSSRGYFVHFEASGRQTNTLIELTANETPQSNPQRIYGTVVGIVTKVKDDSGKALDGMVQVKYPTLSGGDGGDIVSNWARLVSPMAGNGRGFFCLPEVNDEVLVAFENGDVHRPYVLGAVWNGTDATPVKNTVAADDTGIEQRIFKTRVGHIVTFDDSDDKAQISVVDKTGNNKLVIDSVNNVITVQATDTQKMTIDNKNNKITLLCTDSNTITFDGNSNKISVQAGSGGIEVTSNGGDIKLSGVNISLEAQSKVDVKGLEVDVNGTTKVDVKSLQVAIAADTNVDIKANVEAKMAVGAAKLDLLPAAAELNGGAATTVGGAIVKLGG